MKARYTLCGSLLLLPAWLTCATAQVPNQLHYQGRVNINGSPLTGVAQFKFALGDSGFTTSYWSNDGSSTAGSEPTDSVAITVQNGLYGVQLGDTTLTNMTVVPFSVFDNSNVNLRVWVDGGGGFELIQPDQRLVAVGYAMRAASVDGGVDDADADPNNEVQSLSQLGSDVTLSDGGGTISIDDADSDPTNELLIDVALVGTNLVVTDAGASFTNDLSGLVNNTDTSPSNELNSALTLNSTTLEITDAAGTLSADLSSLINDADASPSNELNSAITLNTTSLEITDAAGTLSADLSSLIDDADADPANEVLMTAVLSGNDLLIEDAGAARTIDLDNLQLSRLSASDGTPPNAVLVDASGRVGIGVTPSSFLLEVNGSAGKPGGGSWSSLSDERLKKNIVPLEGSEALARLNKLKGVSFQWVHPDEHGGTAGEVGLVAQEMEEVFPEWVDHVPPQGKEANLIPEGEEDGVKTIRFPHAFNAYLIEAIKELNAQNEALRLRIEELETKN